MIKVEFRLQQLQDSIIPILHKATWLAVEERRLDRDSTGTTVGFDIALGTNFSRGFLPMETTPKLRFFTRPIQTSVERLT